MVDAPKKDAEGRTIPHDHAEVLNKHNFIRRISEQFIVTDNDGKGRRLSSATLHPSSIEYDIYEGLSGDLEAFLLADGHDPKAFVTSAAHPGSIKFAVETFRSLGLLVGYDPTTDNQYHGGVWPSADKTARLTPGVKKRLMKLAEWYVEIDGVSLKK